MVFGFACAFADVGLLCFLGLIASCGVDIIQLPEFLAWFACLRGYSACGFGLFGDFGGLGFSVLLVFGFTVDLLCFLGLVISCGVGVI